MKRLLTALLLVAGSAGGAHAFPYDWLWGMPSSGIAANNRAGGDNIYGTGGPFEHGIRCADCHTEAAGNISLTFTFNPPLTPVGNDFEYVPSTTYDIQVDMVGESLATMTDLNHFAATFEDANGTLMGVLMDDSGSAQDTGCFTQAELAAMPAPALNTTLLTVDCHGIISVHKDTPAITQWVFSWESPPSGDVTLWYGGVDGDTSGESSLDDDTVQGSILLLEP